MTTWLCTTCGVEHPDGPNPPTGDCAICADERQYLPEGGQAWTTLAEIQRDRTATLTEIEPGLFAIRVSPPTGIGHRPLIARTPHGNVLWDAPAFIDDDLIAAVREIGGLVAITSSHPHLTGLSITWSHTFGDIPVYVNADDEAWIRKPDPVIQLWRDRHEVVPGITLAQSGGHFAGSAVLHWAAGAEGKGVLFTGDTIMLNPDRQTYSFMRSYPNRIPLSARSVRRIVETTDRYQYDRVYSGFDPGLLATGATAAVHASAERHIGWITDELRDPADE